MRSPEKARRRLRRRGAGLYRRRSIARTVPAWIRALVGHQCPLPSQYAQACPPEKASVSTHRQGCSAQPPFRRKMAI